MNFSTAISLSRRLRAPLACVFLLGALRAASAQPDPLQNPAEVGPPPPDIGAKISAGYFGPMPSEVQKELIGPYKLLKAAHISDDDTTATLQLYKGRMRDGRLVWYVLTDTTDKMNADALGLNFSAKLNYAERGRAVRTATLDTDSTLVFDKGTVDFSPERKLKPGKGPNAFPPSVAQPGSVGDADYTPLVKIVNAGGYIYNAPVIAFNVSAAQINFPNGNPDYRLVHDKVLKIDTQKMTVTLKLTQGLSFSRPVSYLSFEANDPIAATLEEATLAPALSDIQVGHDDGAFSAVERLFSFTNGPGGKGNPQRQGLSSAIADGGGPINVFGGVPTIAGDYSPVWDMNLSEWTPESIRNNYRSRLTQEFDILRFAQGGFITGPMGKPFGSSGIIITCPVVMRRL